MISLVYGLVLKLFVLHICYKKVQIIVTYLCVSAYHTFYIIMLHEHFFVPANKINCDNITNIIQVLN